MRRIKRVVAKELTPLDKLNIKKLTKWWDDLFQFEKDEYKNLIWNNLETQEKSETWLIVAKKIDNKTRAIKSAIENCEKNILSLSDTKISSRSKRKSLEEHKEKILFYKIYKTFLEVFLQKMIDTKKYIYSTKYVDNKIDPDVLLYILADWHNTKTLKNIFDSKYILANSEYLEEVQETTKIPKTKILIAKFKKIIKLLLW